MSRPAVARMPILAPEQRMTYRIVRPDNDAGAGQFWRDVDCEEFGCASYQFGWTTALDPAAQAALVHYIRKESGRHFAEQAEPDGRLVFTFPAGQRCFRAHEHRVPVEREPLYLVRNGDSRRWTGGGRTHSSAEDWRDDFGEHQQKLHDAAQEG